jgi:hypothetical protein
MTSKCIGCSAPSGSFQYLLNDFGEKKSSDPHRSGGKERPRKFFSVKVFQADEEAGVVCFC